MSEATLNTLEITSHSSEETHRLGQQLGQLLRSGNIVCLSGILGAGKTTFAAGIGQGWGTEERITSPTFVIAHEHHRSSDSQILHHLDAYRITNSLEADSVGLEDIFAADGVVLVEWADNIQDWLPDDVLRVAFHMEEDDLAEQRRIMLQSTGIRHRELLAELRRITADVAGN